uniref:2-iminobutanoate/2-iminopropanoate deaminase-like isoform X3 n=1 Tax=Geotrypetes seraphini TaxID=260995 RepID=A0A6P8PN21_GEOSA|nr:2-iminobutanoate/2-iminopropanoate deaminase-like isoform X3 [Geotrypetes seraphini]
MAATVRKVIYTSRAPVRKDIYSQAVVVDKTMYICGVVGIDVATGQLVPGGVLEETKQALMNMGEILKAAGCDYSNVFKKHVPARAACQVVALPKGSLIEIEAVAVLGPITDELV